MKILIIGSGVSAIEAYKLALRVNDIPTLLIGENEIENVIGFTYILNDNLKENINNYDLFVLSPGVYYDDYRLILLKNRNKKIISEIEYAYIHIKEKPLIIAVTGSNGKTSIVEHLYYVFNKLNYPVKKGGNIGIALSSLADNLKKDQILIVEVSNFQLDHIVTFKPDISIITNITPNHLDRVKDFNAYQNSKLRIYQNMNINDDLIYLDTIDNLILFLGNKHIIKDQNNHLVNNKLIVKKVFEILNIIVEEQLINSFKGVEYRLQKLNDFIYHDGKSTTPSSTYNAIKTINNEKNIILIIGGRNKKLSFSKILELKLQKIIVYGELAKELFSDSLIKVKTLKEAIDKFDTIRNKDSILLYSPGCTSFDQYKNYIERCKEFEQLIREKGYV